MPISINGETQIQCNEMRPNIGGLNSGSDVLVSGLNSGSDVLVSGLNSGSDVLVCGLNSG